MMILPAPTLGPAATRLGSPSCFLCRFVRGEDCLGSSGGGGVDSREDSDESSLNEDDGEPGVDNVREGVSMSKSGFKREVPEGGFEPRTRFDCWELSDDADDSSKVRLGDRYNLAGLGGDGGRGYGMGDAEGNSSMDGDGERDIGSGTCEGVRGRETVSWT